jgi:hypothetical protein
MQITFDSDCQTIGTICPVTEHADEVLISQIGV